MPIKAENRHRYPPDWPAIRERILTRAGNRCEHPGCMARQYSVGWWSLDERGHRWNAAWGQNDNPRTYSEARQMAAELYHDRSEEGPKPIVIVLTIAHLDHDTGNDADDNLAALCQRCHLTYDAKLHASNARATRERRAGQPSLPL